MFSYFKLVHRESMQYAKSTLQLDSFHTACNDAAMNKLTAAILHFTENRAWYVSNCLPHTLGVLLHGDDAMRSTMLIRAALHAASKQCPAVIEHEFSSESTAEEVFQLFCEDDINLNQSMEEQLNHFVSVPLNARAYILSGVENLSDCVLKYTSDLLTAAVNTPSRLILCTAKHFNKEDDIPACFTAIGVCDMVIDTFDPCTGLEFLSLLQEFKSTAKFSDSDYDKLAAQVDPAKLSAPIGCSRWELLKTARRNMFDSVAFVSEIGKLLPDDEDTKEEGHVDTPSKLVKCIQNATGPFCPVDFENCGTILGMDLSELEPGQVLDLTEKTVNALQDRTFVNIVEHYPKLHDSERVDLEAANEYDAGCKTYQLDDFSEQNDDTFENVQSNPDYKAPDYEKNLLAAQENAERSRKSCEEDQKEVSWKKEYIALFAADKVRLGLDVAGEGDLNNCVLGSGQVVFGPPKDLFSKNEIDCC